MLRSEIIRRILERRGIGADQLEDYLHPSLSCLAKPEELPGVCEAADVILAAVSGGKKVVVFGDYDCDGVCATAIMMRTLETLRASAEAFIPNRLDEGYGMSEKSVARLLRENPDMGLLVTVDNGINSVDQVAELKSRGLSVVITDHHLPGDELPKADAIVDPVVSAPERLSRLCGAGIAFLLANRVISEARRRGLYAGSSVGGPMLVLAGLATVTDVMPLLGQNRILVAEALRKFMSCAPMGLRELYSRAARAGNKELTSKDFGFMLGPRINAAGRMASGLQALELVHSEDREITRELARIVDEYNLQRKTIEQAMSEEALAKVVPGAEAQVIDLPTGHQGIAGIVAARVMEKLGNVVPVCVIAGGHGSARSPEGLNIRDAFVACADVLEKFGGHAAAGGFSVKDGRIDEFREKLCAYCRRIRGEDLSTQVQKTWRERVDAWVQPDELTMELAEDAAQMAPFGEGNPEVVFGMKGVRFQDVKPIGQEGRHLSLSIGPTRVKAVWWNRGDLIEPLRTAGGAEHDVSFTLAISDYGERHLEMRLVSID